MREARLVGLSPDGKLILAVAETGEEVAVVIDDRLRAAVRGDRARLGQLEITMESALRPRDIQARIRAGESPESVAQVAQMPVDRVMAFAGPVLAERDHVATIAQRAAVRRRGGTDAPTRNLGTWVTERLRSRAIDPNSAEWDAWRREDGRWAIRVVYTSSDDERLRTAMFAYDAPGRYAVPDDDEARWLVGEQTTAAAQHPGTRRLAAVDDFDIAPDHGADSYEAGFEQALTVARDDGARPVHNHTDRAHADRVHADRVQADRVQAERAHADRVQAERPVEVRQPDRTHLDRRPRVVPPPVDDEPVLPADSVAEIDLPEPPITRPRVVPPAPPSPDEEDTVAIERPEPEPVQETLPEEPAAEPKKRGGRRKNQRASVPSWDEIMFGKKADDAT